MTKNGWGRSSYSWAATYGSLLSQGRRKIIPSNRRADSRPISGHCVDKTVPGVGMALPAWLQHVAQQEQAGQPKAVLQVLVRPAVRTALALAQKRRQPQQPVAERLAGSPRHRAAGFRRHVDQIGGLAGRGAVFQIEPEAEFGQHRQFEFDEMGGRPADVVKIVKRALE